MTDSCCPPETLALYREGALPVSGREAVEGHAAACRACRLALAVLEVPVRKPVLHWAAAAALLLSAVLGWHLSHPAKPGVPPTAPEPALPGVLEMRTQLARGLDLVVEEGAGRLWLEVSRAEPVVLELPGFGLSVKEGAVAASVGTPKAAWFLREACADEATAALWVLRGEAEARVGGKVMVVKAGRKLVRGPEGWREEAVTDQEVADLRKARGLAVSALAGRELVPAGLRLSAGSPSTRSGLEPLPAWRWVTVLKERDPATEVGLTLGVEGGWQQWVLGLGAMSPAPREVVVEVVWDGERLSGRIDGALRFSAGRDQLRHVLSPAASSGWSISAWGGPVTVAKSVLQ